METSSNVRTLIERTGLTGHVSCNSNCTLLPSVCLGKVFKSNDCVRHVKHIESMSFY